MIRPLALAAVLAAFGTAAAAPAPPDLARAADDAAARLMTQGHAPGVAIAVVQNGAVVFSRGYGVADAAKKTPVTVDTRFEIGSITKQFTAACILQLAAAHKLSLDDPLKTFVPEYAPGAAVTIRQLLAQTSGIPEYLDGDDVVAAAGSQPGTLAAILARIAGKPLEFVPGSSWRYSNTNYILLGYVLERAAHEPYEAYVREHVFAPAGMTQSGFMSDEAALPSVATGYTAGPDGVVKAPPLRAEWAFAAGEIVSTLGDLIKWDQALLAGKIVPPADVVLMRTAERLSTGVSAGYGFGWIVDRTGKHPRIWHNGGTFGFRSANITYPADGETIVVLANLAEAHPESAAQAIFAAQHADVAALPSPAPGEDVAVTTRVADWMHRFETGDIDRAQLTDRMSAALTPALVAGAKAQFAPLGDVKALVFTGKSATAGVTTYTYLAAFADAKAKITIGITGDGKIAGYYVSGAE